MGFRPRPFLLGLGRPDEPLGGWEARQEDEMSAIHKSCALVAVGILLSGPAIFARQEAKPAPAKPAPAKPAAAKPAAAKPAAGAQAKHVLTTPDQITWGPAPPALPPGAQAAVLDGDPAVAGKPFAVRIKFPANYRVPPHWHPADENVVVISGTLMIGMGDKMDEAAVQAMPAGTYGKLPRQMHHYAMTKAETVVHLYGIGPFAVTYVNPKDDPRTGTK